MLPHRSKLETRARFICSTLDTRQCNELTLVWRYRLSCQNQQRLPAFCSELFVSSIIPMTVLPFELSSCWLRIAFNLKLTQYAVFLHIFVCIKASYPGTEQLQKPEKATVQWCWGCWVQIIYTQLFHLPEIAFTYNSVVLVKYFLQWDSFMKYITAPKTTPGKA